MREFRAARNGPITDFTELECWQLARRLRHAVYRVTRAFPKSEEFNLVRQLRAASVSATSNIAEGFGRFHYQENLQFCRIARGSLCEIKDQLIASFDEGYLTCETFEELMNLQAQAARSLNGYIRSTRRWMTNREGS